MKKFLAMLLVVVLCVAMVACGEAKVDVSELKETYNALAVNFNEMANFINTNGGVDEATIEKLNGYSDLLAKVAEVVKDPTGYDQAAIDEMTLGCQEMQTWVATAMESLQTQVSEG